MTTVTKKVGYNETLSEKPPNATIFGVGDNLIETFLNDAWFVEEEF